MIILVAGLQGIPKGYLEAARCSGPEVSDNPAAMFVGGFMAVPPMNIIEAEVVKRGPDGSDERHLLAPG